MDEGFDFAGREVLAVGGHVSPTLHDLADELGFGEAEADFAEGGTAFTAEAVDGMAVAALFVLEGDGALEFEGRAVEDFGVGCGFGGPTIHHGRPWRCDTEVGEHSKGNPDEERDDDGHGAAAPAFLTGAVDKWQGDKDKADNGWANEKGEGLNFRRHEGGYGENPEEPEIGAWVGVDLKGVGRTAWAFRTEKERTGNDAADDECRGDDIFINRFWEKWDAFFF